ncbi:unnamed protein product [Rhizophagus irregularis]|nr:unnamed protein product [Rhizophagus irregularis]
MAVTTSITSISIVTTTQQPQSQWPQQPQQPSMVATTSKISTLMVLVWACFPEYVNMVAERQYKKSQSPILSTTLMESSPASSPYCSPRLENAQTRTPKRRI